MTVRENIIKIDENRSKTETNKEDIKNLQSLQESIRKELTGLEKMTADSWKSVEEAQSGMKATSDENKADLGTLRSNVANLQNSLNELMPASGKNREQIVRLVNMIQEAEEAEKSRSADLERAVTACQRELEEHRGDVERKLENMNDSQELSTQLKALDVKYESMMLMSRDNLEKWEKVEKDGKARMQLFEDSLNNLRPSTDKNTLLLKTLQQRLETEAEVKRAFEDSLNNLKPSVERNRSDLEKLQQEVEEMNSSKDNIEVAVAKSKEGIEIKIQKIVEDLNVSQLAQQIDNLDEKYSRMADVNQQKLQHLTMLEDEVGGHKKRFETVEQTLALQEKQRQQSAASEDARQIRDTEVAVSETQNKKSLENVMTEIRSIQQTLQKTQQTVADEKPDKLIEAAVENLSGRVKTIQTQLDESEEERSKLEKKVSETSERFVEMVANNSTELTTVKADMKDLKKAMEESQNDINENKENTEKRLVQMKSESVDESEGLSQLEDRIASMEGKCDELEGRVTSINHTLGESSHKLSSLEREMRDETNRVPAGKEKLVDQLQESIERFEKQAAQKESTACVKDQENKESLESLQQSLADIRQVIR